ncbi:NAD(P)H-dependent glycerol-3-phosphate dehydrogenase [Arthrobacter sp. H14]|uniref:NAD(P)H-dependent glycerol-3-phosphate dehydrogenase n=1 Tax=Arthrobacter sp. H14 TaxID=1312959 RepID=UPI00047D9374|nr:NAD(P)H-dependent glycerol-3-phosphate dehydrogenase [Arthrobacter sp. H14]
MKAAPQTIAVLGAGSWGTTFAKIVADCGAPFDRQIRLWGRREEVVSEINTGHQNAQYLPGIDLPENITASTDIGWVLTGAELVVLAVPAQSLRGQLPGLAPYLSSSAVVVSLMKGLEVGTDARMSEVIKAELGLADERVVVVSGPNLAKEIAREEPTASVVACTDHDVAIWAAELCTTAYFRPYTNTDVVGVEIGGIVKNIIALAVGVCEGKQMGDNTKASVITRGLAETTRLAIALGGHAETMSGLAGLGDLVATCSSPLSRNHTAGRLLGKGLTLEEVAAEMTQTAEGIKSAQPVLDAAQQRGIDMPITEALCAVLRREISVDQLGPLLLARELKHEGVR